MASMKRRMIDFEGPVKGSVANAADLHSALSKFDRTCSVVLSMGDPPSYQASVAAVGQLKRDGFTRFAIPGASKPLELPLKAPVTKVVVTVSETNVLVDGKSVGQKPGSPHLAAAVTAALEAKKPKHEGAVLVIQADENTLATTINQLFAGARNAGFRDVLIDDRAKTK